VSHVATCGCHSGGKKNPCSFGVMFVKKYRILSVDIQRYGNSFLSKRLLLFSNNLTMLHGVVLSFLGDSFLFKRINQDLCEQI
jgi:hypothetical protein